MLSTRTCVSAEVSWPTQTGCANLTGTEGAGIHPKAGPRLLRMRLCKARGRRSGKSLLDVLAIWHSNRLKFSLLQMTLN